MVDIPILGSVIFSYPERLWYILPVVFAIAFFVFRKYYLVRKRFKKDRWLKMHREGARLPALHAFVREFLYLGLSAALVIAVLAAPKHLQSERIPEYGNTRITFIVDVSRSMEYAHDVLPNRLEAVKAVVSDFVENLQSDPVLRGRYALALVPFAQSAIPLYMPFTRSRGEFLYALQNLSSQTITMQGSSFYYALLAYKVLLGRRPPENKETTDIVIILSDGGKNEGLWSELEKIERVKSLLHKNVKIITVGVGSVTVVPQGGGGPPRRESIAAPLTKVDRKGAFVRYLRENPSDPSSPVLRSALDEEVLRIIAGEEGEYYFFENKDTILEELKDVVVKNRVLTGYTEEKSLTSANELFLIPAFILMYIAFGFLGWAQSIFTTLVKSFSARFRSARR